MSDIKCSCVFNHVGQLILEELKLIRHDMNIEIKKIKDTVDNILISKVMANYNPSFSNHNKDDSNKNNIYVQLYGYDKNGLEDPNDNNHWPEVGMIFSSNVEEEIKCEYDQGKEDLCNGLNNIETETKAFDVDKKLVEQADDESLGKNDLQLSTNKQSSTPVKRINNDNVRIINSVKRKRKPLIKRFSSENTWACSICGRGFESRVGLLNHVRIHTVKVAAKIKSKKSDGKKNSAGILHKTKDGIMRNQTNIAAEVVKVEKSNISLPTPKKTNLFKCRLPPFAQNSSGFYLCPYCKKESSDKQLARNHLYSHIKPFKCLSCDQGFSKRVHLKRHKVLPSNCVAYRAKKNRETDSKIFNCQLCSNSFSCSTKLEFHICEHLKIKPYFCYLCNSSLKDAKNYRVHFSRLHRN